MVLYVLKWDVHPDKAESYPKWAESAIKRTVAGPGVVEFRSYRGAAGAPQVVITYEFADMAAWAAWLNNEEVKKVFSELHTIATNVTTELWGPSPIAPAPIKPKK